MEFFVVGSKVYAWVNSRLVLQYEDQTIESGKPALVNAKWPFRDIEVINLDGLPEAEALRLLGVDEKGNDLRALAAKQEQQMAEQAKAADAMAAIPELKTLHEQFVKLQAERVTAPFEAEVAKLNAGYVGGIDREIANEKKAGHLDGVIALEAEKKLIQGVGTSLSPQTRDQDGPAPSPIPAEDDAATTEALKKLRGIYRTAYAKIEAARAENLKALTDPLSVRLKQLEAELTQKDRVPDAKTVREYREGLGEGSADIPYRSATPGGVAATTNEADKSARSPANKLSPEEIVEWVLSRQGKITIEKSGQKMTIEAGIPIPSGAFKILGVDLNKTTEPKDPIPDSELEHLSGLKDMKELHLQGRSGFTGSFLASLSASRELDNLNISESSFQPEHITSLSLFPNLIRMRVPGGAVAGALASLAPLRKLKSLAIHGEPTPEMLQSLATLPELNSLQCISRDWKIEHFRAMAGIKNLTFLELLNTPQEPETLAILAPLTKLASINFTMNLKADQLSGLEALKNLNRISFIADYVTDDAEHLAAKLALFRSLEKVDLLTKTPDDEKFIKAAEVIQKALGKAKVVLRRP